MKKFAQPYVLALLVLCIFSLACTIDLGKYFGSAPAPPPANTAAQTNTTVSNSTPVATTEAPNTTASKTPEAKKTPASSKPAGSNNPTAKFEKISFGKGKSSTTVTHSIAPGITKIYAFGVGADQDINYKVTDKTNQLTLEDEGAEQSLNVMHDRNSNLGGEYRVTITNPTNQVLTYTFYLSVK